MSPSRTLARELAKAPEANSQTRKRTPTVSPEAHPARPDGLPKLVLLVVLGFAAAPIGASARPADQNGSVTLTANEQLFTVLAAINAGGYDTGLSAEPPSGARQEVRAWCERRQPEVTPALARFYHDHRLEDPAEDLGQYISLALLLGPAPDFKFSIPETDLPPDASAVKNLVPLLRRFYREAGLQDLWPRLQPRYDAAIASLSDPVRRTLALTDAFLRFPAGAYLGRTYAIHIELMGAAGAVQSRIYGDNYYLVLTPPADDRLAEIRHQYLHFLLDPMALKYAYDLHQKEAIGALARPAPALGTDFKEDFSLLVTECLIRAVELRMDKPANAQNLLTQIVQGGLILAPYYYAALEEYSAQPSSMSVYYSQMVSGLSLAAERKRLAKVQFAAVGAATAEFSHPAPPPSAASSLLDQGDNLIFEGKYLDAKAAFESALNGDPRNERALYGLAVVASNTRKPDTAEELFKKTLEVARSLRISTWSHIYLGRLYDLEGRRTDALAQYRAAAVTATAFPDAARAAQAGLATAFGAKP